MKHRATTVMDVLLTPTHPLKCVASITVHHVSVTQTVKQNVQLFKKGAQKT
jgi:hypothetical protein